MSRTKQEQLIYDTLHCMDPHLDGTCFTVNRPGLELISSDASFLPAIETALLEAAKDKGWKQLHGLNYVMGAFLVIGTKHAPDRLIPFITSMPESLISEFVALSPIFLRNDSGTNHREVKPSPELIAFIRKLAVGENEVLKRTAVRALKFLELPLRPD